MTVTYTAEVATCRGLGLNFLAHLVTLWPISSRPSLLYYTWMRSLRVVRYSYHVLKVYPIKEFEELKFRKDGVLVHSLEKISHEFVSSGFIKAKFLSSTYNL
ncbi:hypothetical protein HZH68_016996 [Vespula germanica]|uniref:Uncharacterized protein n=1 Tax=Vespula germanica TaxID=30212 RepID=A0A834J0L8_VESGE|nr:hypothetical protein HZH68_016996 [Vespula germanica]